CYSDICFSDYCLFSFCFFFSSRRRHTRSKRDWSSDVCSSDLSDHAILLKFESFLPTSVHRLESVEICVPMLHLFQYIFDTHQLWSLRYTAILHERAMALKYSKNRLPPPHRLHQSTYAIHRSIKLRFLPDEFLPSPFSAALQTHRYTLSLQQQFPYQESSPAYLGVSQELHCQQFAELNLLQQLFFQHQVHRLIQGYFSFGD